MSVGLVAIVLSAALLHAFWNAVVKGGADKTIMLGLIALGHMIPGFAIVLIMPSPGWQVWPYVVVSTVIHWGYYYFLNVAYRLGDLSVMYPIARGLAPVLIAVGAQVWIGETLSPLAWGGILCVSAGIMVLTRGVFSGALPPIGLLAALACAVMVAGYSLVDGVGVRLADNTLSYVGWLFLLELPVAAFIFSSRMERLWAVPPKVIMLGLLGGMISGTAYGMVLYAKTFAPLGIVSAMRETSVIFAAMIGVLWFGEGPKGNRLVASVIVAGGIILIGMGS
jgi:drug/metabolite transporter (DMT)-like permease